MEKNAKDKPVGKKEQSNTKTESNNLFASRLCYSMEIPQMSVRELADALYVSTSTVKQPVLPLWSFSASFRHPIQLPNHNLYFATRIIVVRAGIRIVYGPNHSVIA